MATKPLRVSNIEDLALELGAAVKRQDGSVFNAAGRSGVTRLPVVEKPAPEPKPTADTGGEQLAAVLMEMMGKLKTQPAAPQPAPVVNVPPAQVVVNQQPRCSWDFVFTRNSDGSIKSIRAIPVKE